VGYGNLGVACELEVRSSLGFGALTLFVHGEAHLMLPKLAYLTLCRSIQLLALLGRGDASKDLEIVRPAPPAQRVAPPGSTPSAGAR
jgi:hypothetical protein